MKNNYLLSFIVTLGVSLTSCRENPTHVAAPAESKTDPRQLLAIQAYKEATIQSVAFSPDGNIIATVTNRNDPKNVGGEFHLKIWDANSGQLLKTIFGNDTLAFSPDGSLLATGDGNVYDTTSWNLKYQLPLKSFQINNVAFSSDNKKIAVVGLPGANQDNILGYVLDAKDGSILSSIPGYRVAFHSVSFSSDGTRIVTSSSDVLESISIWDITIKEPKTPLFSIENVRGESYEHGIFSKDGKTILVSGYERKAFRPVVRIFEAKPNGWSLRAFVGNGEGMFYKASFSPDETKIIAAGNCGFAQVFDLTTDKPVIPVYSHGGSTVMEAIFSPDQKKIATVGVGGMLRVWKTE